MGRRAAKALGWYRGATWSVVFLWLGFYLAVYGLHAYALLHFPFDYDQGEGYDVNSAWLLSQGLSIYASPDQYPFYSSNYPPLFSLLLAPAVALFGPRLALGRLLSLGATALAAAVVARAVQGETGRWRPALLAGLFFLASPYVYHVTPLARVNALMLALALCGVYAAGRAARAEGTAGRRWLALSGALLLAALYSKQMALDAAAAAVLYVFLRDRRRGLALGGGVLLVGGALYLALDLATAGGFSLNVLWANANPFSLEQAVAYFRNFLEIHPLLVLGALALVLGALVRGGLRGLSVYALYLLAGLAVALGTGKWGAGESYFQTAIAAACVLFGCVLARVEGTIERLVRSGRAVGGGRPLLAAGALASAAFVLLLGQLLLLWHGPWERAAWGAYDRGVQASMLGRLPTLADVAAGSHIADYLVNAPGDVLAEESAFALVARRRVLGNATQQRNLYAAGRHDPAALVAALASGEISVVVLNGQQYPAPVLAAIGQNCYLEEAVDVNGGHYLVLLSGRRSR